MIVVLGVTSVLMLIFGIGGTVIERVIPDDETED